MVDLTWLYFFLEALLRLGLDSDTLEPWTGVTIFGLKKSETTIDCGKKFSSNEKCGNESREDCG